MWDCILVEQLAVVEFLMTEEVKPDELHHRTNNDQCKRTVL